MNKRRRTLILDTDPETLITLQQVFATTENSFRELIDNDGRELDDWLQRVGGDSTQG